MELVIGTYNMFVGAVKRQPNKVMDDLEYLMSHCHILFLQEAGQADSILLDADKRLNVERWKGAGTATEHTQVMFRDTMNFKRGFSVPLTPATFVGDPGAGPKTLERKDLNVAVFRYNGRRINAGSFHGAPSIYIPVRRQLAVEQVSKTAHKCATMPGISVIGGDWNMEPDNNILDQMDHAGMRSAQSKFGWKDTHGNRAIDDIYWKAVPEKVRPVRTNTYVGISDHKAFILALDVHQAQHRGTITV